MRTALAVLVMLAAGLPAPGRAETDTIVEGGDIQRFQPAVTSYGGLATNSSEVLAPQLWMFGAHLNYARNPLIRIPRGGGGRVAAAIDNNLTLQLHAAYGITDWFELGLAAGAVPWQSSGDVRLATLSSLAFNDLRILPRFRVISQPGDRLSLTVTPVLSVPLGGALALAGDTTFTFTPEFGASYRFESAVIAATALVRLRDTTTPLAGLTLGKEVGLRLAGVDAFTETLDGIVELSGAYALDSTSLLTNPLEALIGGRLRLTPSWALDLGLGIGLFSAPGIPDFRIVTGFHYSPDTRLPPLATCERLVDGSPRKLRASGVDTDRDGLDDTCDVCAGEPETKNGFEDFDGCPDTLDRDHDGFADADDRCPDEEGTAPDGCTDPDGDGLRGPDDLCPLEAEDLDTFQDLDGCPDPDNDGDGVLDGAEARLDCVDDPEDKDAFEDADGCPDPDNDQDGILDTAEARPECVNAPEDKDGFEDADGCPDPDNDQDGILDAADKCPLEPGVAAFEGCPPPPDRDADTVPDATDNCPDEAGVADNQGCPIAKKQLVVIKVGKIEILDSIYFAVDKDVILPKSFPLLDNVVQIMKTHPEIERVRVEGHTDNQGDAKHNLQLSDRRAKAVVKYLVDKGVDAARLEAQGFGQTRPIVPNVTPMGRAKNRRVEFNVVGGASDQIRKSDNGPTEDTIEKKGGR